MIAYIRPSPDLFPGLHTAGGSEGRGGQVIQVWRLNTTTPLSPPPPSCFVQQKNQEINQDSLRPGSDKLCWPVEQIIIMLEVIRRLQLQLVLQSVMKSVSAGPTSQGPRPGTPVLGMSN